MISWFKFNARKAYDRAEKNKLRGVLKNIKFRTKDGSVYCDVYDASETLKAHLTLLGFKVETKSPRTTANISWNLEPTVKDLDDLITQLQTKRDELRHYELVENLAGLKEKK